MKPTLLSNEASVSSYMPQSELALYGPHSRHHQIDEPNGAGWMGEVTGGAWAVAAVVT